MTVGGKGSGKTFRRGPHFVINEFLPDYNGTLYTTLPLFPEKIYAEVAKRTGRPVEDFEGRIQIIPEEVLAKWRAFVSGPWEYFKDVNLDAAHVQFDECHNFAPEVGAPATHKKLWADWLGEIRHMGCTVEFISQNHMKLAKNIKREAAIKLYIENMENDRALGVRLGDWWELTASITGTYKQWIAEDEHREKNERWQRMGRKLARIEPFYFQFYDSFSAPLGGGQRGEGEKRFFERYGRLKLLLWFLSRNILPVGWRFGFAGFVIWIALFGGLQTVMASVLDLFTSTTNAVTGAKAEDSKPGEGVMTKAPDGPSVPATTAPRPPGKPDQRTGEPLELLRAVADKDKRIAALEDDLAKLRGFVGEISEFVMLTRTAVITAAGDVYHIGETIPWGTYEGRTITDIDFAKRAVRLNDGKVLRVLRGVHSERVPTAGTSKPGGGVPEVVRSSGGTSGNGAKPSGADADGHAVRGENAAPRVPPVPEPAGQR